MIKVLVVDDSAVAREFISHLLAADPQIEVVGAVQDGAEAIAFVHRQKPDVITMDINMPVMNGLEATRRIMELQPLPIVIVSANWDPGEVATTFKAMEAGALAIVQRPKGIGHSEHKATTKDMVQTVKLMSEVRVVRRRSGKKTGTQPPAPATILPEISGEAMAVVIGASTGGPLVIKTILDGLPRDFPAALLIVQHIAPGFLQGMVDWLAHTSTIPLKIAVQGERILSGQAYFAPEGYNMGVGSGLSIQLSEGGPENVAKPSVSHLFRSVAGALGKNAVGILLTGMGSDGAKELKLMREKGALTIVQDRDSSVVYGMPGAAVELGAADYILAPDKIVAALGMLMQKPESLVSKTLPFEGKQCH